MTWTKPHILLLDEPSNHLDIDACNALIEGLATFKGGVLMVGVHVLGGFSAENPQPYNSGWRALKLLLSCVREMGPVHVHEIIFMGEI
jgi:hypothetical protein